MEFLAYNPKDVAPPKFGKTALELLDEKTVDPPSLGSEYGFQLGCGLMGAGAHVTKNWIYRRPFIAG